MLYNFNLSPRRVIASEQVPVLRFRRIVHFHGIAHGAAPAADRQPLHFLDFALLWREIRLVALLNARHGGYGGRPRV